MRTVALLLLAATAYAQPVVRTSIDMMPGLEPDQRAKLYRAFYAAQGEANRTNGRIKQIDAALKKKPAKAEAQKLSKERAALQKRIPGIYGRMFGKFRDAGLDDRGIARIRRMPRGALREERYNHSVVLEAPGLTDAQRTLLERCVASIEAAQRALGAQHKFLSGSMKEADKTLRRQVNGAFYNAKQQMEKRFWQVMYYALTPGQMVATRKLFSPRYRYIPQLEQQMYLLPGMTPSQANRVRALFREHESEVVADQAAQKRLNQRLRDKKLAKSAREALQAEVRACNARLGKLNADFRDALIEALSEDQLAALRSVPPMMNVGDRYQGIRRALQAMKLDPEQTRKVTVIRRQVEKRTREIRQESNSAMGTMMGAELGPESPQQMTMQMMQRQGSSRSMDLVRANGHTVITEILRPRQVTDWIVAPG
jgi:hypothetical protein